MTPSNKTTDGTHSMEEALADINSFLARDGFTSDWETDESGAVTFHVGAGEAECPECLVPKAVLEAMLNDALEGTGHPLAAVQVPVVEG